MSYQGTHNGIPIYDYLDEVPDRIVTTGQRFFVVDPPDELKDTGAMPVVIGNSVDPITWSMVAMATVKVILVISAGIIFVVGIQQFAYLLQGRPGQKVDKNLFEGGDGSVWVKGVNGIWTMQKGPSKPRVDIGLIIWGIVAVLIIGIVILIFLKRKEIFPEKKAATPDVVPKKSGPKKKNNPCPKEE